MRIKTALYVLIVLVIGVFAVSCSLDNLTETAADGDSGIEGTSGNGEKEEQDTDQETDPGSEKEEIPGEDPDPDQESGFEPLDFTGVADGTSLEEYGFIVGSDDTGEPGFIIRNGVIESDGAAGGWLTLEFPEFHISRLEKIVNDLLQ